MNFEGIRGTIIVPTSDTVTAGTATHVIDGYLGPLYFSVPALEGTGTATVLGTEPLGGTVYASVAVAESVLGRSFPAGTPMPFSGTLSLTATTTNGTDGTQSANRAIVYNLYYQTIKG